MIVAVDTGYVGWAYGSDIDRQLAWSENLISYDWYRANCLVFVHDGDNNLRVAFDSHYKSRRHDLREHDQSWLERSQRVKAFQKNVLQKEPFAYHVRVDGLEADDIIATLGVTFGKDLRVIGTDKDLLQNVTTLERLDGTLVTIDRYAKKLPKACMPFVKTPEDMALSLALMGDDSDSVVRLIPPRQLQHFAEIMSLEDKEERVALALSKFGEAFTRNYYLVGLPGPWCYYPLPAPDEYLSWYYTGERHGFTRVLRSIIETVSGLESRDQKTEQEIFGL